MNRAQRAPVDFTLALKAIPDSVREARLTARSFAEVHGVTRPDDVALAVSEAATNVVVHAYPDGEPGPLWVTGAKAGPAVVIEVRDRGGGLRPRHDSPGLGLGLPTIAQVADTFDFREVGRGVTVSMTFAVA